VAAAAIEAAWNGKDNARVGAFAEEDVPDPRVVVDTLLLRGSREAAEAFAKAAPRKDVERLPDFVAAWSATEADKAAREAIDKTNAARAAKRGADALAAIAAAPEGAMPFLALRLVHGHGLGPSVTGRAAEAAERFCAAAAKAEALGWLARAARALRECAREHATAKGLSGNKLCHFGRAPGSRIGRNEEDRVFLTRRRRVTPRGGPRRRPK